MCKREVASLIFISPSGNPKYCGSTKCKTFIFAPVVFVSSVISFVGGTISGCCDNAGIFFLAAGIMFVALAFLPLTCANTAVGRFFHSYVVLVTAMIATGIIGMVMYGSSIGGCNSCSSVWLRWFWFTYWGVAVGMYIVLGSLMGATVGKVLRKEKALAPRLVPLFPDTTVRTVTDQSSHNIVTAVVAKTELQSNRETV